MFSSELVTSSSIVSSKEKDDLLARELESEWGTVQELLWKGKEGRGRGRGTGGEGDRGNKTGW